MKDIIDRIIAWNEERGLIDKGFDHHTEWKMLHEELEEFMIATDEEWEQINALCDLIVLSVGAMAKMGIDPKCAMNETLKEIESRTGAVDPETGKWMKDKDAVTYKPQYIECVTGKRRQNE